MTGTHETRYEECRACPSCESQNSEIADVQWNGDTAEQVVLCNECPTEWRIEYSNPKRTGARFHGEADDAG